MFFPCVILSGWKNCGQKGATGILEIRDEGIRRGEFREIEELSEEVRNKGKQRNSGIPAGNYRNWGVKGTGPLKQQDSTGEQGNHGRGQQRWHGTRVGTSHALRRIVNRLRRPWTHVLVLSMAKLLFRRHSAHLDHLTSSLHVSSVIHFPEKNETTKQKWQDPTLCSPSPLGVCSLVLLFFGRLCCLLDVFGFWCLGLFCLGFPLASFFTCSTYFAILFWSQ